MSYEPYLDCDWTQLTPEMSHVLYLSDEEIHTRKTLENQKIKHNGRTTQRNSRRATEPQKAA